MKFLLVGINAKYIHSNPALYSLRAYAGKEYEPYIETVEYTINHRAEDILGDIYMRKPDIVGFSCYIWNFNMILNLITEMHKVLPTVPIWLGGPEVSFDAEKLLWEKKEITGIMVGEGEETFLELLQYYLQPETKELSKIPGLVLHGRKTPERELTDLSSIPFLYQDIDTFQNRIIYYESSRGCPYRCSYCLSSIDKKVRLRDIAIVKKELTFFLQQKVKQVKFIDRTFNCNHNHTKEIWQFLKENDNGVTNFHFEVAGDILSEEEIRILNAMRPGLVQLEIGVQSTNPETLKAIDRVTDMEKLKKNVKQIHVGENIHVHLDLIAGLPFEDYNSFQNSFDEVYAMRPNQLQLGFLKVLKGSKMHKEADKYGICYQDKPPYEVLYTRWLSFEDILKLKRIEEVVELYYNSSQFTHTLIFLEQAFPSAFEMYERLSRFYQEKGYAFASSSRNYRYQILLEFAISCDKEYEDVYRELLTFDTYLRENVKSRPDFAIDLEPYKATARNFYLKEEKERNYLTAYETYDAKQMSRMTHLEPFYYPVYDTEGIKEIRKMNRAAQPSFILFDYRERNPLTYEARICNIEISN